MLSLDAVSKTFRRFKLVRTTDGWPPVLDYPVSVELRVDTSNSQFVQCVVQSFVLLIALNPQTLGKY